MDLIIIELSDRRDLDKNCINNKKIMKILNLKNVTKKWVTLILMSH